MREVRSARLGPEVSERFRDVVTTGSHGGFVDIGLKPSRAAIQATWDSISSRNDSKSTLAL
jgi:hypothetical protein